MNLLMAGLNIFLAAFTLWMAWVTYKLSQQTLTYVKARDLELDTRNGWIEIHKAMVNLRVQRGFVMLPGMMAALGAYSSPSGSNVQEVIANYTLASSQLLGQLDRLNDDPLLKQISEFLNANLLAKDWQTPQFEKQFDAFVHQVAFKSRPT
jgi:hypothetical protein